MTAGDGAAPGADRHAQAAGDGPAQDVEQGNVRPASANTVEHRESPYFGLDYYEERYGAWFFGREAEGSTIITNLRASRLTLLHGASGVGKSSLLRAGVARRLLQARTVDREVDLPIVFSSWSGEPVVQLIEAIESAVQPWLSDSPAPELTRECLADAIDAAAVAVDAHLVVILDQFEEYLRYRTSERPTERFADELADCLARPDLPTNFLISIREDAYAGLGELFRGRFTNVYRNYLTIEHLPRRAAEEAIRRPLEVYGRQPNAQPVAIEDGLVEAVLDAAREAPEEGGVPPSPVGGAGRVATPLLQLVMESVWSWERARGSNVLRRSTLAELHGVERIVDTHLEEALNRLTRRERDAALDVFDRLVTESGGKIAQAVPDLADRTGHSEEQVGAVLVALDEARLVRPVPAPPGKDPLRYRRYEIFHDVLGPAINRAVQSHTEARLRRERNAARRRVALALALALAAVAFGIFALVQRQDAVDAQGLALSTELSVQSQRLLTSDIPLAALLGLEADAVDPTDEARAAVNEALQAPLRSILYDTTAVQGVAFAHSGILLASANRTGQIRLWNASSGAPVGHALDDGSTVYSLAFSPDGKELATGDFNGGVVLWDLEDDREVAELHPHGGPVYAVAFSPDGRLLAAGDKRGAVELWDVADRPTPIHTLDDGTSVTSVAFSPDGRTLASGDELSGAAGGDVVLWNVPAGTRQGPALGDGTSVDSIAFSPTGAILASGDEVLHETGGEVVLWNLRSHTRAGGPLELGSTVVGLAFSPDGATLASGDEAGVVGLWTRLGTPHPSVELLHDGSEVDGVAFSPDGRTVASADNAGQIVFWSVNPPSQAAPPLTDASKVSSVSFSPDGRMLASGDAGDEVRLWHIPDGAPVGRLPADSPVTSVAFSPDGRELAVGDEGGQVSLWDLASDTLASRMEAGASVTSVAFSPNGKLLATGRLARGRAGNVQLWDVASGTAAGPPLPDPSAVASVAFSPDGEVLASGDYRGKVILWSVVSHDQNGRALDAGATVKSLAFSRNGVLLASAAGPDVLVWSVASRTQIGRPLSDESSVSTVAFGATGELASGDEAGSVVLSDPSSGEKIGRIPGNEGAIDDVAFSPAGSLLASGTEAGEVQLLSPGYGSGDPSELRGLVCREVRTNLTPAQWHQYVPGEGFRRLCPGYP
jgi:WD40 repeat protein